jgi:hypothetical protein
MAEDKVALVREFYESLSDSDKTKITNITKTIPIFHIRLGVGIDIIKNTIVGIMKLRTQPIAERFTSLIGNKYKDSGQFRNDILAALPNNNCTDKSKTGLFMEIWTMQIANEYDMSSRKRIYRKYAEQDNNINEMSACIPAANVVEQVCKIGLSLEEISSILVKSVIPSEYFQQRVRVKSNATGARPRRTTPYGMEAYAAMASPAMAMALASKSRRNGRTRVVENSLINLSTGLAKPMAKKPAPPMNLLDAPPYTRAEIEANLASVFEGGKRSRKTRKQRKARRTMKRKN